MRQAQTDQWKPEARPSVLDLLRKKQQPEVSSSAQGAAPTPAVPSGGGQPGKGLKEPKQYIGDSFWHVAAIQKDLSSGLLDLKGSPWVQPGNPFRDAHAINEQRKKVGERLLDSTEALNLTLRPAVFVWSPEHLCPGQRLQCPKCNRAPLVKKQWGRTRILHSMNGFCVYITMKYTCSSCPSMGHTDAGQKKRTGKHCLADDDRVLAALPPSIATTRDLIDTGRIVCDAGIADLMRTLALRVSWSALADAVNELMTNMWVKNVTLRYLQLCDDLQIAPGHVPADLPDEYKLRSEWLRDLYMWDFSKRQHEVVKEITTEIGDEVLVLDWTVDAAKQCGRNFLFNAMTGGGKVLVSKLTDSAGPNEVKPAIWELKARGLRPRVVYVDDHCCGTWAMFMNQVWPGIHVRLDGMHALRRVTQTTSSTQHPWHGRFCIALSQAIYKHHPEERKRLQDAWARAGNTSKVPTSILDKYVPKRITDASAIAAAMNQVIESYSNQLYPETCGPLLTSASQAAWAQLRRHVEAGCLCDPPGIDLHVFSDCSQVVIAGEIFRAFRTLRGTSALEGFHSHQKQWLGPRARHAGEAGLALLTDGMLRWNRKRNNVTAANRQSTPLVFTAGILQNADDLHMRLTGKHLYNDFAQPLRMEPAP